MPLKRISPPIPTQHPDLVSDLVEELKAERLEGPSDAPFIVEELLPRSDYLNVRVIWDRWDSLSHEERMDVILTAYRTVRGIKGMSEISSAVGFTRAEAERLGVAA